MDELKNKLERQLLGNLIRAKCMETPSVIFREELCTQERCIRFTTQFWRTQAPATAGYWNSGDCVMYEVHNEADRFVVECVVSDEGAQKDAPLYAYVASQALPGHTCAVVKSWDYTGLGTNRLLDAFEKLLEDTIPAFEEACRMPCYEEGEAVYHQLNKYERNRKARQTCIAAHGCTCSVCGFDFGKVYGDAFAGIIEVHHLVPISQIGKKYVVDPVKDLRPVCANCHTALHSKKDGVYTIEELKALVGKGTN